MKNIKVYSKPNCGECKKLKMWLNAKNIEFDETDITEDKEAYDKIIDGGKSSLPVLEIEDEFVEYDVFNDILELI